VDWGQVAAGSLGIVALLATIATSGCATSPEPVENIEASTLSQSDEMLVQQYLDSEWDNLLVLNPDADRPDVARVRLIDLSEWSTVIPDCLAQEGFDVDVTPDGDISYTAGDQGEAYAVAFYTCEAKYPYDPKYIRPLTDAQLGLLYDYFVTSLQPCLIGEGYDVPPAPSRQEFLENYAANGGWFVYEGVAAAHVGPEEFTRINKACPQLPDNLYD
jgi:hypothetical protein